MGNNQPGINYLNDVNQTIDGYKILRGNPDLDNTRHMGYSLIYEGVLHKYVNLQGRVEFNKNVHQIYDDYFLEGNKIVNSYTSEGAFNTVTANLNISSRFSDNLRTNIGINYNYMYVPETTALSRHNIVGLLDVNYFICSFAINAYLNTPEKGTRSGDTGLCGSSDLLWLLRPLQWKELDGGGWHGEPLLQAIKV